jgi:hypothetical protein
MSVLLSFVAASLMRGVAVRKPAAFIDLAWAFFGSTGARCYRWVVDIASRRRYQMRGEDLGCRAVRAPKCEQGLTKSREPGECCKR